MMHGSSQQTYEQTAEKPFRYSRTSMVRTCGTSPVCLVIWFIWLVWFVLFIWIIWFIRLVWFNQINKTNQTNHLNETDRTDQMNKIGWRTISASC